MLPTRTPQNSLWASGTPTTSPGPRAEGAGAFRQGHCLGHLPGGCGAEGQIGKRGKEPAPASAPQGLTVRHNQVEGFTESVTLDLKVAVPGACHVAGRVAAAVLGADRSFALQHLQSDG